MTILLKNQTLTGRLFTYWYVEGLSGLDKQKQPCWNCICIKCGTKRVVNGYSLLKGFSKSCGCLRKEKATKLWGKYGFFPPKGAKVI